MDHLPALRFDRLLRLMLWMHWRAFVAQVKTVRRQSPLLLFVLGGFVAGYLGVGYWLFRTGLHFLYNFPLVGALLSQRILFLIFGFFFVMLMFSNLIIGYTTLFRNRETQWMLSLPIRHRDVYRWKFIEALVVSSWALIFLSAPMMAAYGRVQQVPPVFYVQVALLYIPFVVLPALLGSWLVLALARALSQPFVKRLMLFVAAGSVLLLLFTLRPVTDVEAAQTTDVLSFDQLLKHTRLSLNPLLPSAWLAKSVLSWGDGLTTQGAFYFLVLVANALFGLLIGFEVMGKFFYGSWTQAHNSRAARFQHEAEARRLPEKRRSLLEFSLSWLHFFSQPTAALILKDIRVFWRDPAQWIQFMIFFGLLCIYVVNLRNVAFNFSSRFWEVMISHLNLAASALTLSTLTTRFVFPQFSLEGRRLWILSIAPVGLHRVLLQKFWMSCLAATFITVTLMVISSVMLHLPWSKVAFFALAIALMSAALSGLSVGLGALFPNFKEDNPSKIVSGFGGTLCLVVSFLYISLFVALVALPDLRAVTPKIQIGIPAELCLALAISMSLVLLFVPLFLAMRRVKRLEM